MKLRFPITNGRRTLRTAHGAAAHRRPGKRADYLLRYTRDLPLAVVEAKAGYKHAADGLQQAKDYAAILSLPFAYATNGTSIIEFDFLTGTERTRTDFPTPEDLWARYRQKQHLAERGVDFQTVAAQAGKPDADPFDLLCHLAFNAPVLTRRQRADRVKGQHVAFFTFYAPHDRADAPGDRAPGAHGLRDEIHR